MAKESLVLKTAKVKILKWLEVLIDKEREELFATIRQLYCSYCGRQTSEPGETCHCNNDE